MRLADLTLAELERYAPPRDEPDDFDAFWTGPSGRRASTRWRRAFAPVATGLRTVDVLDVTCPGFGGDPIKGGRLPCVVSSIGYGGGRGQPFDWLLWASFGMANLVMDTRGQGGSWSAGDTPDRSAGPKRITVWPYNEHEGGETHQVIEQIAFLREAFGHRPATYVRRAGRRRRGRNPIA